MEARTLKNHPPPTPEEIEAAAKAKAEEEMEKRRRDREEFFRALEGRGRPMMPWTGGAEPGSRRARAVENQSVGVGVERRVRDGFWDSKHEKAFDTWCHKPKKLDRSARQPIQKIDRTVVPESRSAEATVRVPDGTHDSAHSAASLNSKTSHRKPRKLEIRPVRPSTREN